jgi:hypothetical protein
MKGSYASDSLYNQQIQCSQENRKMSSRHCLSKTPVEIAVGWDNPLQTFFLQAFDPGKKEDEDDVIILWLGRPTKLLPRIADLEAAIETDLEEALKDYCKKVPRLREYGENLPVFSLTPELRRKLEEDRASSGTPTDLQCMTAKMFAPPKSE